MACIVGAAAGAILLFAGDIRELVIEQRWLMYSLFIGLTLGGVPLLWREARPATPVLWTATGVALALMCVMAFAAPGGSGGNSGPVWMFLAGVAAASAMILPGVSGGYLLLLLGQYEAILGTIDQLKRGLLGEDGQGPELGLVVDALGTVVPLGLGVVVGVVGVSNVLAWLLQRSRKATLGGAAGPAAGSRGGALALPGVDPTPGRGRGEGTRARRRGGRGSRPRGTGRSGASRRAGPRSPPPSAPRPGPARDPRHRADGLPRREDG